jgi:LCP family protein required for cell wall assembly
MSDEPRAERDTTPASRGEVRRQGAAFFVAILLLAGGALYAALAIAVRVDDIFFPGNSLALPGPLAHVPGLDAAPADSSTLTDRINILILGLDRRPHHDPNADGPPRSDSMYILSIDPVSKTGGVLGIPRDLYVNVPNPEGKTGDWTDRINTAYHYGELYKYPGGGPALARKTVEQTFKITIDYYVTIDWVGFADIVDALGGIDVTVPAPLQDVEAFDVHSFNDYTIDIPAGRQHMDSLTALAYSRYRGDEGGDLARIQRQQQVMQAAMDKALSLGWLANAPSLWSKYRHAFETDITPARLPGLIALARQIGPDRLTLASLAGEDGSAVRDVITPYGEDVLIPNWEKMVPILQSVIFDRRLREEGAQVKVVNGSTIRGQAARTAMVLMRYGLAPADVTAADADAVDRRPETVVLDYSDKEYTAHRIAEWLNLPRDAVQRVAAVPNPGDPDILVIIGQGLKLPPDSPLATLVR